jgi:8-oxo-dGTP pyrophosphatase MutT (NUDIX family)
MAKEIEIHLPLATELKERIERNQKRNKESTGVSSLLKLKGYYVLVLNTKPPFNKKWIFPSGGVKNHETFEEAVTRETKEETNLDVTVKNKVCILKPRNLKNSKIIVYECEANSNIILPGRNIEAVGLFKTLLADVNPTCIEIINCYKDCLGARGSS